MSKVDKPAPGRLTCPHCGKRIVLYVERPRRGHEWAQVDWRKTTGEIARELGCSLSVVSANRLLYAPQTRKAHVAWGELDWSWSTTRLARKVRASAATVSSMRRVYAPETLRPRSGRPRKEEAV